MSVHTFDALKSKNFSIYMVGQSVALTGMWVQKLATSWLVYRITDSAFLLGLVELLSNAPIFVIGLLAGAWLEKHDIRKLIIFTQTLTLIHALVLAILLYTNTLQLWHILVLSFYLGIVFSIDMPARQASLILMVNKNSDLKSAIALHSVVFNLSRLVGPTLAGFIIYYSSEASCFAITAVAYIPVIAALFYIKFKARNFKEKKKQNILKDIIDVMKYSKNEYHIATIFIFFIVIGFFSYSYTVMLPIFAKDVLGGNSQNFGFLQGFFGLGAMVGAFAVATFVTLRKLPAAIIAFSSIYSVSMILFAISTNFYFSLIMMIPAGLGLVSSHISTNIYLQSASRDDMRGRIASLYSIGVYGLGPLGAFFAGIVTEHSSPQISVIVWSIFMLLASLVLFIKLKKLNKTLEPIWNEFEKG